MRSEGRELALFVLLLVTGLALANLVLVALALLPLAMLMIARNSGPETVEAVRKGGNASVWTGGEMEVHKELRLGEGRGIVVVKDTLPPHSSLARGSNIKVLWKPYARLQTSVDYRVRFNRRGRYRLGPGQVQLLTPGTDWPARTFEEEEYNDVVVRDRTEDLRALSNPRSLPRLPLPDTDMGIFGAQTTEFLEIRPYVHGDRYRNINWKATSRSAGEEWPLVNQYKIEEERCVLLLLDNSLSIGIGASGDDVFERCVHVCLGLSHIYLGMGLEVGLMAIDSREIVAPGRGRRQELVLSHRLLRMDLTDRGGRLSRAMEMFPNEIKTGPLVIIVTSIRHHDGARIGEDIKLLRTAMGRRGRVVLINVRPLETPVEGVIGELAQELADLGVSSYRQDLSDIKVPVHTWNPREGDFIAFVRREFGVPG